MSYNIYGISCPVYSKDPILTPSKLYLEYGYLQHKPFYRQQWFMVSLAATSIIIIIMIVSVLCVKSKSYKYKREFDIQFLFEFAFVKKKINSFSFYCRRSTKNPWRIDGNVYWWSARIGIGAVSFAAWYGQWNTISEWWHNTSNNGPKTVGTASSRSCPWKITTKAVTSFSRLSQRRRKSKMLRWKSGWQ